MFDKINKIIDNFEKVVITIGMAAGTLLLFANVVLRYLFDSGITWALEAVQYIFAWVVLVGAAHGVKVGIHLGIDIRNVTDQLHVFVLMPAPKEECSTT